MARPSPLPFTPDDEANELLATEPLALLIGMLLDQQFPMERAFASPAVLKARLGGRLDVRALAEMDPDELAKVFVGPPALHRFPGSMAGRTQQVCQHLLDHHDASVSSLWEGAADGRDFYRRVHALPGFGDAKSRIYVAIIGRRLGLAPAGWEEYAATWASIADVDTFERIGEIREKKRILKSAAKAANVAKGA
jgi:uncharacterized HhH-GPD family protein